jgi:hypothetical protein
LVNAAKRGAELLSKLGEQMQLKAAGVLVDQLTPVRKFWMTHGIASSFSSAHRDRNTPRLRGEGALHGRFGC